MKLSAILSPLIAAGVSGDIILATVKAFEEQQNDALERRRESDRMRQDRKRQGDKSRDVTLRHSDSSLVHAGDARGDVKQINLEIPNSKKEDNADKPLSDLDGFKAELFPILNKERIEGLVSGRRKKKAPLTAYTGRLLAKALRACPDVNVAADEMIVRNWTSIKPEWLEAKNSSRQTGPPGRESEFARHQRECTEALERSVYGDRPNDKPSSNSAAFDLEPGDWRTH